MRVLIAGGLGFVGSHTAARFAKEGHEVFILDPMETGKRENVAAKHLFYMFHPSDRRCEEVFRLHNIDVVIYVWHPFDAGSIVHLLSLSARYGVKKFLFLSKTGAGRSRADERQIAEECCRLYQEAALSVVIARLAHVYGPRQDCGVVAEYMRGALQRRAMDDDGRAYDLVYVEDAVDAIFRIVQRDYQGEVINISSNTQHTLSDINGFLGDIAAVRRTGALQSGEGEAPSAKADNTRCAAELGWSAKYSPAAGLRKTYDWFRENLQADGNAAKEKKRERFQWRPYAENLLLFGVMAAVTFWNNGGAAGGIGIDYNFIYIAAMGLLYGKSQALPAAALSSALLMGGFLARGADFVAVLYQAQHMVHFAAYLFFGVLTGYITDNKDRAYHDLAVEVENVKSRYRFLEEMYLKNIEIKERLYKQIVNSGDSIGRAYKIVKKLDTIELENLFTAATEVAAEMMDARHAAIYVMNKSGCYLRLKTRIGLSLGQIPNSLKVEDYEYLQAMAADRQVFVNRMLVPGLPDMAAPVLQDGRVIAVLQIYQLKFTDLSLNKQNLLKITSLLIAGALTKAYQYEASIQDKKYLPETRILAAPEFAKLRSEIRYRQENNENEEFSSLLKLDTQGREYVKINEVVAPLIRDEDFLGVGEDGCVYLLLLYITPAMTEKVRRRLEKVGLTAEVVHDGANGRI